MGQKEPKITVLGIGDGGCRLLGRLYFGQTKRWELIALHTNAAVIDEIDADYKHLIGVELTSGKGADNKPEIGERAALLKKRLIHQILEHTDLLILVTGLSGGTGTGVSPVIAEIAHELGVYTIAIVIKPFEFQGESMLVNARSCIHRINMYADQLLIINSDEEARHIKDVHSPEGLFAPLNAKVAERLLELLIKVSGEVHFVEVEENVLQLNRRQLRELCEKFYEDRRLALLARHEWR